MQNITIIPARGGSKNLKNKNIKIFNGKPLIYWTINQAKKSKFAGEVFVSTDSIKISEIAKKNKCKVIKRPKKISLDNSSSESAIRHLFTKLNYKNIDYIIFLQCTSPLRSSEDIDNAIKQIKREKTNSLFSVVEYGDLTLWRQDNNKIIPYNYNPLKRKIRQKENNYFLENGSIYIFKPSVLLKKNNRIDLNSYSTYKMNKLKSFEIDDKYDFNLCNIIFKKLNKLL